MLHMFKVLSLVTVLWLGVFEMLRNLYVGYVHYLNGSAGMTIMCILAALIFLASAMFFATMLSKFFDSFGDTFKAK